jgi:uncharacterized protein (DUF1778 family)
MLEAGDVKSGLPWHALSSPEKIRSKLEPRLVRDEAHYPEGQPVVKNNALVQLRVDSPSKEVWRKAADARARSLSEFIRDSVDEAAARVLNEHMLAIAQEKIERREEMRRKMIV